MKKFSLAYFGTPYFSALFLEKLLTDRSLPIEIKLVVTQPDKPVGRKQIMTQSPVKTVARKYGVEIIDSINMLGTEQCSVPTEKTFEKIDLAFLFAYGNILPNEIINLPKFGFWNTHPSLLPKYRGASPIAMPLILDDKITGVTLIKLDQEVDHGPIIAQEELQISPTVRRHELEIELTNLAFEMFKKTVLSLYGQNSVLSLRAKQQNHSDATSTRLLTKDDGFISFEILKESLSEKPSISDFKPKIIEDYYKTNPQSKENLVRTGQCPVPTITYNLFRGLYPWPGIWTIVQPARLPTGHGKRLKLTELQLVANKLSIKKVQLEGKKEVDFETFNRAYRIFS